MTVFNLILHLEDGSILPYVFTSEEKAREGQDLACEIWEDVVACTLVESELDYKFTPDVVH